jgi:hypothetical protein
MYIERAIVPFKTSRTPGDWLDCWFDTSEGADKCRLMNDKGALEFEGIFVPYEGSSPVPQSELILDRRRTGTVWTGSYDKGIHVPLVYLTNGQILLPKAAYAETKRTVDWLRGKRSEP